MPTYQYACTGCGEDLEVVQKFTDDALTECPACGGKLRKVFSPVGVVFKGSGFYRTDSRDAKKPAGAGAGATASSTNGNGSSNGKAKDSSSDTSSSNGSSSDSTSKPATTSTKASETAA